MQYPIGSDWRKWDLHIHSPLSILNNQFPKTTDGAKWDEYLSKLETLNDLAVIGVTDYFTIEGYKILRDYKDNQGRISNISMLLPNIEFRLDTIVSSKSDGKKPRRINLHVIFSNDVNIKHIEESFLHNLEFVSEGTVQGKQIREKLKVSNLEELGQRLKNEFPDEYQNKSALQVGATNATVTLKQITDELTGTKRFKGKYIIVLDEAYTNLIEWGEQDTQTRMTLLQSSDMVFSSNKKTRQWCLGQEPYRNGQSQFIDTFKSLKPCIHGSDAHDLFYIGYPCAKRGDKTHNCEASPEDCELRYCWIKADPTFEGLKQVLYEPEDRVRIQSNNPTPSRQNHTLSQITLTETVINNELTVGKVDLPLHHGLIAVTGGRGAGKTAFVDLIANCFNDRVNQMSDSNSFVKRIGNETPQLQTTIQFVDAEEFTKAVTEVKFIDEAEIAYISQGELDHYITENTRLTERITELIFSGIREVDKYDYENISRKIEDLEHQIIQISSQIIELEAQTTDVVINDLNNRKKRIDTTLRDIERQINKIVESTTNKEDVEEAQKVQEYLATLRSKDEKLKRLRQYLTVAKSFIDNDVVKFNDTVESINELLSDLETDKDRLPSIDYSKQENVDRLLETVEEAIKANLESIDKEQGELDQQESKVAEHTKLLDTKNQSEKELESLDQSIHDVEVNRKKLTEFVSLRASNYKEILTQIKAKQDKYRQIIKRFSEQLDSSTISTIVRTKEVLKDIDFFAEIQFNQDDFLQCVEDLFHNRRVNVKGEDSYFADTLVRFKEFTNDVEGSIETLAGAIELHTGDSELRNKMKQNSSINEDDFFKVFYKNYFIVKPIVKYKNNSLVVCQIGFAR